MMRSAFSNRVFTLAFSILLASAAAVPVLINVLSERYGKEPIDLRLTLHAFNVDALPTFQYREGVQVVGSGPEWVGTEEMFTLAFEPREWNPSAGDRPLVILFVTYYSDPDDTIPHTPEVCYRQAGGEVRRMTTVEFDLPGRSDGPFRAYALDIRMDERDYTVVYFFYHNGRIVHDRERLRFIMSLPGDRFTYFSKVEAAIIRPGTLSFRDSIDIGLELLRESVIELADRHFPADADLRR